MSCQLVPPDRERTCAVRDTAQHIPLCGCRLACVPKSKTSGLEIQFVIGIDIRQLDLFSVQITLLPQFAVQRTRHFAVGHVLQMFFVVFAHFFRPRRSTSTLVEMTK